ncbi:tRNA lysidine(34) synthetase TilS [Brochothrix campestris]|uniref:tRNA(Ile)-lysidine synthase n=1 Tax=Brochothrix campestris FSL F6-1037 TaxID=1265861 RepID=W7CI25_9LIST|nr:tRNA lysidine(34) synthetase TilS [Brochothrix campestris]EUJ36590.1 bifunctional protein TilS/HprT [Brochothrix campestris FSL F6-1037]
MLHDKVKQYCDKHDLIRPGERYLLAISGGVDSMALLHYFATHFSNNQLAVVNVNHQLRNEAYQEAKLVQATCQSNGIAYISKTIDVKMLKHEVNMGVEAAARIGRYRCFEEALAETNSDVIVLAHHADDQSETILMRLTRGSHGSGYAGMPQQRSFSTGRLIRPFLAVSKKELKHYVEQHNIAFLEDASNATDDVTRNRFRHHILPLLHQENAQLNTHLSQFHEDIILREGFITTLIERAFTAVAQTQTQQSYLLNITAFKAEHQLIQEGIIRRILSELLPHNHLQLTRRLVANALDLLKGSTPSAKLYLPSQLRLQREYDEAYFYFETASSEVVADCYTLGKDESLLMANGQTISCRPCSAISSETEGESFIINDNAVLFPLTIRTRLQGDRVRLKGMDGRKKVKKLFIDQKIPRQQREQQIVVVDATGEIIWLPGMQSTIYETAIDKSQNQYIIKIV